MVSARVDYRGPGGAVEAPLVRLVDGEGRVEVPKSIAWQAGAKPLAEWLSSGGLRNLKPEPLGAIELKFPLPASSRGLRLEFGDVPGFAIARDAGTALCASLLKPEQLQAPRAPRSNRVAKADFPVHRARYPCSAAQGVRTIAAEYPPYLPRQLLVFGRGFLPNAREIELPMGRAAAQPYAYSGLDSFDAVEAAARRAVLSDFPGYPPAQHFAFNWGSQRSASGNEMYSVGIYELRACPK